MQTEPSVVNQKQRKFFETGTTRSISFRKEMLAKLLKSVREFESAIEGALQTDLGKSAAEAYLGEIGFALDESQTASKNLENWACPQRVSTPVTQWPGKSLIYSEPLGVTLIIGPWNYPFQLLVAPLIGAIAAGNCAVLKPSELAPATSKVVKDWIEATFPSEYVCVVEGGIEISQALLHQKWDHIFFTGGAVVGKIVLQEAAKFLTPVTLELGGKSPCIVDETIDLKVAARRIAWGKFFNAGQTCVAPDYLLVPKSLKLALTEEIKGACDVFFGRDSRESLDYGRIINESHFDRLASYLKDGKVVMGGDLRKEERYFSPTILFGASLESRVMQEEIFGPLLPVIEYQNIDEALSIVKSRLHPLALYVFTKDKKFEQKVIEQVPFGGGCVNDTLVHLSNSKLPFGGVGNSGMGNYHGKYSFDTFSHKKSVLKRSFFADLKLRYPPYAGKLDLLKKFIGG